MGSPVSNALTVVRDARAERSAPLVLELDLTVDPLEGQPTDPVSAVLARRRPSLGAVLDGLRRAAAEERVKVVLARISPAGLPLARVQELRDAITALRAAGTAAVAFSDSFGEFGGGTLAYYLASAFEEIWLAPPGDLGLTGVALETPFLRDALDRLGVRAQIGQRHEYKNAANTFLERDFTPAHREASERIVASAAAQIVAGIATGRGLAEERVRELIDGGPLSGDEALAAGLVDRLGYRDEVYDAAKARAGADARLLYLGHYRKVAARRETAARLRPAAAGSRKATGAGSKKVVAIIHGTGPVLLGAGRGFPQTGPAMHSDAVTAALRAAGRDDDVAAVVFRVDSPGGSYVASDLIRREVERVRASGRPVVVSMGAVAASGGYFVAMGADTIVAQPGTLTGSIGVLGGKQVVSGLLERVGVNVGAVREGRNALILSPRRAFTDDELARLDAFLDRVYADFTAKVAAARGLPPERVHEIARGRVWTGADALDRGLVDELGGLDRAVELAWAKAGLPAGETPRRRPVPRAGVVDRLRPVHNSEERAAAAAAAGWAPFGDLAGTLASDLATGLAGSGGWGALAGLATRLGLPAAGPLVMPPVGWMV
jgi:protease IV